MSIDQNSKGSQSVYINVYDMYTMNNYISALGVGVYHCGVEIHGVEYGYGGHPFPFSGIFEMIPKDCEELGEAFRYKETIEIGKTDFTKSEVEQIVSLLGREFRGIDYHLINRNCNSFSSKLCKTICGEDIPAWVNRLAYISTFVPFIERVIPKEWISPIAVQHTVETHIHEATDSKPQENSNPTASSDSNQKVGERSTSSIWSSIFTSLDRLEQNENLDQGNKAV